MSKPELQGFSKERQYRLYTVEHVPFETFPAYAEGGPATTAHTEWSVSGSYLNRALSSPSVVAADDGLYTLHVYRFEGSVTASIKHELDGTKYATDREATKAAYEAGVLAFMVYERDEAQWPVLATV